MGRHRCPTWFTEAGPAPRGRTRKGSGFPRQRPGIGSQSVLGRPEGRGPLPRPAVSCSRRPGWPRRYLCPRAPPVRVRAARRRAAGPGVRAGRAGRAAARSGSPDWSSASAACPRAGPGCPASPSASGSSSSCCSGCGRSGLGAVARPWPGSRPRSSPRSGRRRPCCCAVAAGRWWFAAAWVAVETIRSAGRSAGCPGAGCRSPSRARPGRTPCPTSAWPALSFLLALLGALLAQLVTGPARVAGRAGRRRASRR